MTGYRDEVDLTDEASVAALAEKIGTVDHVVSTESARARGTARELTPEAVQASLNVKVVGAILLAKHFAPRMPEDGSLVFLSGASARKVMPGMLAVGATNAAVDAVTRSLAVEFAFTNAFMTGVSLAVDYQPDDHGAWK